MKRLLACICGIAASAALLTGTAGAFSDVYDPNLAVITDALSYLDIVSGVGADQFAPDAPLTRAQFCKMIITTREKADDISTYKNYTVFPDVPHTYWGSAYINMAVMKTEPAAEGEKQQPIISGYPDGTFRPEKELTLGEACTVAMRMLGYQTKDIGMFWPDDYVAKARQVGLLDGIQAKATDVMTRGETATLIYNLLLTKTKDGTMYVKSGIFKNVEEDRIIISDHTNDYKLHEGQVRINALTPTDGDAPIYDIDRDVPGTLMGKLGMVILDDAAGRSTMKGFLPYRSTRRNYVVSKTTATAITTTDGTQITMDNATPVILDGRIVEYGKSFFDLLPGSNITITYKENGSMESVNLSSGVANDGPYMLTSDGTTGNPLSELFGYNGGTIYKNGAKVDVKNLRKYDVATYDRASNTYYVTDSKVCGMIVDAEPALQNPSTVKVLGKEFQVLDSARKDFEKAKLGDVMTLILSSGGKVVAAVPEDIYKGEQYGILESAGDGSVKVRLIPGNVELEGTTSGNHSNRVGSIVRVFGTEDGKLGIAEPKYSNANGDLNLVEHTLGDIPISPAVHVYERAGEYWKGMVAIDLDNIDYLDHIDQKDIEGVVRDSGGGILAIILKNATGEGYVYGRMTGGTYIKDDDGVVQYTDLGIENMDGIKSGKVVSGFKVPYVYGGLVFDGQGRIVDGATLEKIGTARLVDFQGTDYVKVAGKLVPISGDVVVYVEKTKTYLPIDRAKSMCSEFDIYINPDVKNSQVVRMIVAR